MKLDNKGFNLVVMSMVILVMSMIMAATVTFYSVKNVKEKVIDTKNKFKVIEVALKKFAIENGRFPCPAPLNCSPLDGCVNSAYSIGRENGVIDKNLSGICNIIPDGVFSVENSDNKKVYYGGVPALTLGLSTDFLVDSWGNKITYMISESSTNIGSFNEMIYNKRHNIISKYLKDGILYLLISFSKSNDNSFSIDSQTPNSGSNVSQLNLINDFLNNGINTDYFNFYKQYVDFNTTGIEKQLQKCLSTNKDGFNFLGGNYGEVVFANETCVTKVTNQIEANGYSDDGDVYNIAVFINNGNVYMNNRPALKCQEDGTWSSNYIYECRTMEKCSISDLSQRYVLANLPTFNIVNTGMVTFYEDKSDINSALITFLCIVEALPDGSWQANWYRKK